jgi:hypothetical protein
LEFSDLKKVALSSGSASGSLGFSKKAGLQIKYKLARN